MKIIHLPFALLVLIILLGCGDSTKKSNIKEKLQKLTNKTAESIDKYKDGDLSGFRAQMQELKSSLNIKDFSKAQKSAEHIDKILKTKIVAQSIEFLRIESTDGVEKAKSAIVDYMAKSDLGEDEKKACHELMVYFDAMDKKQLSGAVGAIVYIALESKMNHSAAIPAAFSQILVEEFFKNDNSSISDSAVATPVEGINSID